MNHTPLLHIEFLEDRSLPSSAGTAWADPGAISVSFAPDSTRTSATNSVLFKTLNGVAPAPVWQAEILRAFQTWAGAADVGFGLVKDGGQAFGTPGDIQGDMRFGDIRIGAAPLVGSLANTAPPGWALGTWSGDIMLNSLAKFAIGPASPAAGADLYTVALHEIGHALGLGESDDPGSAMYRAYVGPRGGLSADDVSAVRALYGARTADRYEGSGGNDTLGTATSLGAAGAVRITADLTDPGDADVFSFVPAGDAIKVRVAAAGISLLRPDVAVFDATGVLVARKAATDWAKNDVAIDLKDLTAGATYYVRVAGPGGAFGVGRYQLSVAKDSPPDLKAVFEKDDGADDTPRAAGALGATDAGPGGTADAVLEGRTDVDWYRLQTPAATDGTDQALIVRVRTLNTNGVVPALTVLDATGATVPYEVLARDAQTVTVQVLGNRRAAEYLIGVASPVGADASGNYRFTADFRVPTGPELTRLVNGQLGGGATAGTTGTLVVAETRLFQFDFYATSTAATTFTLRDQVGKAVLTLVLAPGQPLAGAAVYLGPGTYTVEVTQAAPAGGPAEPATYGLYAGVASDPIGTRPTTTTGTTAPAASTTTNTAPAYFYTTPTAPPTTLGLVFTF